MCGATPTSNKIHFKSSKPRSFHGFTIQILIRRGWSCQFGEKIGILKIIFFTQLSVFAGFVV